MTGIERLRKLIEDYRTGHECDGFECGALNCGKCMANNVLEPIADQIEREQDKVAKMDWDAVREVAADMASRVFMSATIDELLRDWSRKLTDAADGHERAADVSMSAYDLLPQEDREAIAWVREHGGIAEVKEEWNHSRNLKRSLETAQAKVERQQRHIEFVQRKCRERQEHICELNKLKRAYVDALNGVCKRLGLTDGTGLPDMPEVIWTELDRRLMPEGMEWLVEAWPRFEDDAPVRFCDDFERDGEQNGVDSVGLCADGSFSVNYRAYSKGERVKRPAPKVYDADGAVVEPVDGRPCGKCRTDYLTHERPDSWERLEEDADGIAQLFEGVDEVASADIRYLVRRAKALAERDA